VLEARDITGPTTQRSALVLAPHPDDETIGAGATIARKVAAGTPVRVVVAADGNDSTRRAECREACRRLGLPDDALTFLGLPDGALAAHETAMRDAIGSAVEEFAPAELIVPSAVDTHPDHRALAAIVARLAAEELRGAQVLSYPIWFWNRWAWTDRHRSRATQTMELLWRPLVHTLTTRTRVVRTGEFLDVKHDALAAHQSQVDASWGDADRKVLDPEWLTMFLGTEELFFAES
jgi:LmbE family N-acetylglucosaminyl deacetylase